MDVTFESLRVQFFPHETEPLYNPIKTEGTGANREVCSRV